LSNIVVLFACILATAALARPQWALGRDGSTPQIIIRFGNPVGERRKTAPIAAINEKSGLSE
jgi:hypothetical protein